MDDHYGSYFAERIDRVKSLIRDFSTEDLIRQTMDLEDFSRKKLTRRGLDVLCRKGRIEDLERIRRNLESGYTEPSKFDAEYLEQHGEWSDLKALTAAYGPKSGSLGLAGMEGQRDVARATVRIGRSAVSELMSLEMPSAVLKRVVELCPESRFSKISDDALLGLLDHGSDEVRKAAAIKAVRSFPAKRVRSILHEYVSRDGYRYYNVIHWLDLAVSMPRRDARRVAAAASS